VPGGASTIQAFIRAIGNSSFYEGYAESNVTLGNTCQMVNSIVTTPTSPQPAGTTIALSATASCTGGATPEFRYYYTRSDLPSSVPIGTWSTSPVSWNTSGLPAGIYTVLAMARATGNSSTQEAVGQTTFTLQPSGSSNCTATLTATNGPVGSGKSVPLSATANCGANPTFRFAYAPAGSSSYTYLTSWGTATNAVWDTSNVYNANYDLVVFVRKSTTTTGYDGINQKTVHVGGICSSIFLNWSSVSSSAINLSGSTNCFYPQFSYFRTVADGSESWSAVGNLWVTGSIDFDTSGLASGYYDFKVEAREGTVGAADGSSDPINIRIGPGCWFDTYDMGHLTGHPVEGGNPFYLGMSAICDEGITPEYAFFYLPPNATEYIQFPGTDWQLDGTGVLDTTDITVGGTYGLKVLVRGVGQVGFSKGDAIGTFDYAP